jgi:ethanolamine ammonia-lyase large subunit
VRQVLGLRPAPEFEAWLQQHGIFNKNNGLMPQNTIPQLFKPALQKLQK